MNTETKAAFDQWAILELLGHVRLGGRVTEEEHFGAKLGRIDIPRPGGEDGFTTQFFSAASIYRLTPTTEALARQVAATNQPQPVHRWEMPLAALPAPEPHRPNCAARNDYEDDLDSEDLPTF